MCVAYATVSSKTLIFTPQAALSHRAVKLMAKKAQTLVCSEIAISYILKKNILKLKLCFTPAMFVAILLDEMLGYFQNHLMKVIVV